MRRHLLILLALTLVPIGSAATGRAVTAGPLQYVKVDDGTSIAVGVFLPAGYQTGTKYPALVEIEGYGGAYQPNDQTFVGNPNYVVVAISVRGTGCSAGTLDLFSDRSAKDGAYIIDHWIPNQAWSNGKVGIYGHSYGGLMGFLVAAHHPSHLVATAVSGLIDDFYRGILYPGGVLNPGFPILWGGLLRPESEHSSVTGITPNVPPVSTPGPLLTDRQCQKNYLTHKGTDLFNSSALVSIYSQTHATPNSWALTRSLLTHIAGIRQPIQLGSQSQDEQTGPRGAYQLYQRISPNVPKRLVLSTGRHNPNDPTGTKKDWLDCWILGGATSAEGNSCADVMDPSKRVLMFFESEGSSRWTPHVTSDWPAPELSWTREYLHADGTLSPTATGGDGTVRYVSTGTGRQITGDEGDAAGLHQGAFLAPLTYTSGLPDTARYTLTFPANTTNAIAGPMTATLWAKSSSPDVDFWVELLDRDTTSGATTFIQRGLLRASARAVDLSRSDKTPAGDIYRPYHPFLTTQPVTPQQAYEYLIEVFPADHVFRPGHELVVQIHAPPANDPISTYAYEPNLPSVVTILQDAQHRSSILLPFLDGLTPANLAPTAPGCGQVVGEECITPALG